MRRIRFGAQLTSAVGMLLIATAAETGTTYKWVDAGGQVHLSDRPPAAGTPGVEEIAPGRTLNVERESRPAPGPTRAPAPDAPTLALPPGAAGQDPRACPAAVAARIHALDAAARDRDHASIPALYASFARVQLTNVLPDGSRHPGEPTSAAQFAKSLGESLLLLEGYQWLARRRLVCSSVRDVWVARGTTEEVITTDRMRIRIVTEDVHHLSMASGLITKSHLEARWTRP